MGQNAAAKKGTEFLLDEAGSGLLSASRACEEGLEVLAYDLVEKGSFGLVALIFDGVGPYRDRVLHRKRSKFGACSLRVAERRNVPNAVRRVVPRIGDFSKTGRGRAEP